MPLPEHAEDLVCEGLADAGHAVEIEHDGSELLEAREDSPRLGARDVDGAERVEPHLHLRLVERVLLGIGLVLLEHVGEVPVRPVGDDEGHRRAPPRGLHLLEEHVLHRVVDRQLVPVALQREDVGRLGGEEDAFAGVGLRLRGRLALEEILDRLQLGLQPALLHDVAEDADAVVLHLERQPAVALLGRHGDGLGPRVVDGVIEHLGEAVLEDAANVLRQRLAELRAALDVVEHLVLGEPFPLQPPGVRPRGVPGEGGEHVGRRLRRSELDQNARAHQLAQLALRVLPADAERVGDLLGRYAAFLCQCEHAILHRP